MKILNQHIKLDATKGKNTIAKANDVFLGWIDSDFENYETDKEGLDTKETEFSVLEMDKNGTFKDIFTNPEKMVVTQGQIIKFCEKHKELLHSSWSTFFLFKVGDEFFVADVDVRSDGLFVFVFRFSLARVWSAVFRHRFVVPQLALDSSETSSFDTLTLSAAIELVKKEGYLIYKKI